jgi:FkbH-like protein
MAFRNIHEMEAEHTNRLFLRQTCQVLVGIVQVLFNPVAAATTLAVLCSHLHWSSSPWVWLAMAPILYLVWLILFLVFAALETTLVAPFFKRPDRECWRQHDWPSLQFSICWMFYKRLYILATLPLVPFLLELPLFNRLVLRAYSPRLSVGKDVWIGGAILDPDITHIGSGVVIGASSRIVAHSHLRKPNGDSIYQSAPIVLGDHCVIGGAAQVELGAKIGEGAIIEPASRVLPFTVVPPGEIWGGSPAVFHGKRENPTAPHPTAQKDSPLKNETAVRRLIADALGMPVDAISPETGVRDCPGWDSLGKMAIAAAMHTRFGLQLPPETIFALNSVQDVADAVLARSSQPAAGADDCSLPSNPELLPLLDSTQVLAALAKRAEAADISGPRKKVPVRIAATFVAQPLASALQHYARAFGLEAEVSFFDFNQVPQALLSPASPWRANRQGLNVILVRPEDLPDNPPQDRQMAAGQLIDAIRSFVADTGGDLLVGDLPPMLSRKADIQPLQIWWRQQLAAVSGVEILDFAGIVADIGHVAAADVRMEQAASAPYSAAVYCQLGVGIARALRKRHFPAKKIVAVDCDNTLWGGVVGEDGSEGIQLGEDAAGRAFRAFQSELLALKERGVLLALVSKNLADDIWNVLDHHPGMILRRKDFAAAKINWQSKPENLRQLAAELNLGLDSFVFMDDNPAERLEVEACCPQVTVVPLPSQPALYAATVSRLWLFDGAGETSEDKARNDFVLQENARRESQSSAGSLQSYLASLELKVSVRQAAESDLPRVVQLLQKTNQFNLSLRRHTLTDVQALLSDHALWTMTARDRFGDYGMIGLCISKRQSDSLFLDSYLMSCRALGRGLDQAFLHVIARQAGNAGLEFLRGRFVEGPRNQPMKQFLETSGFKRNDEGLCELEISRCPSLPPQIQLMGQPES